MSGSPVLVGSRIPAGDSGNRSGLLRFAVQATAGGLFVGGASVLIGLTAPHWPSRWLRRDVGPLRLLPFESRGFYERILPDGGQWFGGSSKSVLPDPGRKRDVNDYVVELRRGEWVHWVSNLAWLPNLLFLDRRAVAGVAGITVVVNGLAIGTLRYNRIRVLQTHRQAVG